MLSWGLAYGAATREMDYTTEPTFLACPPSPDLYPADSSPVISCSTPTRSLRTSACRCGQELTAYPFLQGSERHAHKDGQAAHVQGPKELYLPFCFQNDLILLWLGSVCLKRQEWLAPLVLIQNSKWLPKELGFKLFSLWTDMVEVLAEILTE